MIICTFILWPRCFISLLMSSISVGKMLIPKMLPRLCKATNSPIQTNHCLRSRGNYHTSLSSYIRRHASNL